MNESSQPILQREPAAGYGAAGAARAAAAAGSPAAIGARLDRLPVMAWHYRIILTMGTSHMFDLFDALTVAFILPVLIKTWHLSTVEAGLLVSISYVGQLVGSLALGHLSGRYGRRPVLRCRG